MLHRFLTDVVGEPAVLLGHSMGAVLAMQYTAEHPGQVTRLAVLSPPVPGTTGRTDWSMLARRAFLRLPGVAGVVRRKLARLTAEQVVAQQLHQATPHADRVPAEAIAAAVAETRMRQEDVDADLAQAVQWAGIIDTMALWAGPALAQDAGEHRRPTLWLHGGDDPMADPAHAATWPPPAPTGRSGFDRASAICWRSRTRRGQQRSCMTG
jgi:pimeloyl-ACP methyl ester carboxylesterase